MKMLASMTRTLVLTIAALVSVAATSLANTRPDGTDVAVENALIINALEFKFQKANAANTYRIAVNNPAGGNLTLCVKDGKRTVWSTTLRNQSTMYQTLNLAKLAAGDYQFEITDGTVSYSQPVTVQ